jgi:transposase
MVIHMYFAGIDIAKKQHEACIIDDQGTTVLTMPVPNTQPGAARFLAAVRKRIGDDPHAVAFCLEATGHYWLSLYCFLTQQGYPVHVINPIQSDAIRNLYIRKSKTDRKDAFILADLLRMNQTEETCMASEVVLKLQTLSRTRFAFVNQVSALKQRAIGVLDRIFPEYASCFSDVFIKTSRELLKNHSTPDEIAALDLHELTRFLESHSRGRLGQGRAERIQELARGTFGIGLAVDAFALELRLILSQIEFIEAQISDLESAIKLAMEELQSQHAPGSLEGEQHHVIETIPGIGTILAAAIIGEIGDIHRFSDARKLVAYAGIDATVRQSGEFTGSRNRMSKRGSPELRRAIWLAAVSARRFNAELSAFYEAKKQQGKHPMVATGAVARRLVHLIHSVWSREQPFDPDYRWSPSGSAD